jgi:hypothetical protein
MMGHRLSLLRAALVGVLAPLGPGASSPAFAASSCVARAYVTNSNASPGTVSVIDVATVAPRFTG